MNAASPPEPSDREPLADFVAVLEDMLEHHYAVDQSVVKGLGSDVIGLLRERMGSAWAVANLLAWESGLGREDLPLGTRYSSPLTREDEAAARRRLAVKLNSPLRSPAASRPADLRP